MAKTITITARAFALLARPVVGQGGYQTRLRNLQAELGIEPDDSLLNQSPGSYSGPIELAQPIAQVAPAKSKREMLLDKLMEALDMGDVETPAPVKLARRQGDRMTLAESDVDSEADLQATLSKALAVRREKAALHAVGRVRKSPRLSDEERAKRSARMVNMWKKARKATAQVGKVARKAKSSKRR